MRRCDIGFLAALVSAGAACALLANGRVRAATVAAVAAAAGTAYGRAASRHSPRPMPPALAWTLQLPRGRHAPRHLLPLLQPQPGEHILEIGPGIGVHAIPVARAVAPEGRVAAVDVSPVMLAKLARRAARAGISSIEPQAGNACNLPHPDGIFEAAYLISVLGEVPDRQAAWAELRRVLKAGGRLVIGEIAVDPDFVPIADIRREAEANGFRLLRMVGGKFSYLALFRRNALDNIPQESPQGAASGNA